MGEREKMAIVRYDTMRSNNLLYCTVLSFKQ